jgi:hypothetical protein
MIANQSSTVDLLRNESCPESKIFSGEMVAAVRRRYCDREPLLARPFGQFVQIDSGAYPKLTSPFSSRIAYDNRAMCR